MKSSRFRHRTEFADHAPIPPPQEPDLDGGRRPARAVGQKGAPPQEVTWRVREAGDATARQAPQDSFIVPARFVELAKLAILHRAPNRFALLYRLLWRVCRHHDLLTATGDSDVAEVLAMADAVRRDIESMKTGLRFREIGREQKAHFVAWFAPTHRIVAAAAPCFASRYADMPWSILTPDACAHWDGHAVTITPGIPETPHTNRLEETWRQNLQVPSTPLDEFVRKIL